MSVLAHAIAPDDELIAGLRASPKRLPSRLHHDACDRELSDAIARLDAFYPTRTELRLLDAHLPAIAEWVGPNAGIVELGGAGDIKTKRLLRALAHPAVYIGIDTDPVHLDVVADALQEEHRELEVHEVIADFMRPFALPRVTCARTVVFVPGMAIDSLEPFEAVTLLGALQQLAGKEARLVLVSDGTREPDVLLAAYDDEEGRHRELDASVLERINATRGATFQIDRFRHCAVWNASYSRVELELISTCEQEVVVDDERFWLDAGEPIITDHIYKHTPHAMCGMLMAAGWDVHAMFTASEQPMRLWLCEPRCG